MNFHILLIVDNTVCFEHQEPQRRKDKCMVAIHSKQYKQTQLERAYVIHCILYYVIHQEQCTIIADTNGLCLYLINTQLKQPYTRCRGG